MATDLPGYTWSDPEAANGHQVSAVVIWRHGRWQTLAHCAHPGDAREIAAQWAAEFVVEVWTREFGQARRVLRLQPTVGSSA